MTKIDGPYSKPRLLAVSRPFSRLLRRMLRLNLLVVRSLLDSWIIMSREVS